MREMQSRNSLYFIIGGLLVVTAFLGYIVYEETRQPTGVEISIGQDGVSIQER